MSWTLSDGMHEQMGYKNKTLHVIFIVHQLCNSANRDLYKSAQQTRAKSNMDAFYVENRDYISKV